jgi:hypothetical protein
MRPSIPKLIAWSLVAILFYATFARLAYSGADIPVDPHAIVLEYRASNYVQQCLLTFGSNKRFFCDRIYRGEFD